LPPEVTTRPYVSAKRDAAAAAKREHVLDVATRLLAESEQMISMEAVAKAAGVTRLTVYKQFGSRRGLLEAIFDANAARAGIKRIVEAMQDDDPRRGIRRALDILCDFWGSNPSFGRLHDAAALDPDFAEAIAGRNERRRLVFMALLGRMDGSAEAKADCADLIFALTSMQMFRALGATRSPQEVADLLATACLAVVDAKGLR